MSQCNENLALRRLALLELPLTDADFCQGQVKEVRVMLGLALLFLLIAIVAAVFGFGGIAGSLAWIAQLLLGLFVILLIVSVIAHFMRGRGHHL
jgi:uncharacterized membrane protein YtjA (UPF0391 family)